MPRLSPHEILLKIARLESAIAERTAAARAAQVPPDGVEAERIMELIKLRDRLQGLGRAGSVAQAALSLP